MKKWSQKHPALVEVGDTILSILSGSFALIAILIVWIREVVSKRRNN